MDISGNKLGVAPDLSAVSGTLQTLDITSNLLTAFPNITMSGTNAKVFISNQSAISESNMHTVCHIGFLHWSGSVLTNIPQFRCEISAIYHLRIKYSDLDYNSDMTGLEILSTSVQYLAVSYNTFTIFPNLPMSARKNLKYLWLAHNEISVIPDHVISGYKLDFLKLNWNRITAIPSDLLTISSKILLHGNPLNDWDHYKWNKMMCGATYLQYLDLRGTMSSLAQLPDIHASNCNRTQTLTINLKDIPGPCDC